MKTLRKPFLQLLTCGIALFTAGMLSPSAQATTYINQDFSTYPEGSLATGAGWIIGANVQASIVNSAGNKVLQLGRSGSGTASYTTNTSSNTPLVLAKNTTYVWKLDFYLDAATPTTNSAGSYIWIDSGTASRTFGGFYVGYSPGDTAFNIYYFSKLDGANNALDSYTLMGSVATNQWYSLQFEFSFNNEGLLTGELQAGTYTGTITNQANVATFDSGHYVRMNFSPQIDGSIMQYDNFYLAMIPEPGSVSLGLGITALVACMFFRRKLFTAKS